MQLDLGAELLMKTLSSKFPFTQNETDGHNALCVCVCVCVRKRV